MKMKSRRGNGFSLVELLVVIGIIAVLIGLLLPSLAGARRQAKMVQCQSNLQQIGLYLVTYLNDNNGWLFPPDLGSNRPRDERWPVHVFKPAIWNPPIMKCPEDLEPAEDHSYILNDHLKVRGVKYHSKWLGKPNTEIVVMGEKRSSYDDYYMNTDVARGVTDYYTKVNPWMHGLRLGSNYLFLDIHVETRTEKEAIAGVDPWGFPDAGAVQVNAN